MVKLVLLFGAARPIGSLEKVSTAKLASVYATHGAPNDTSRRTSRPGGHVRRKGNSMTDEVITRYVGLDVHKAYVMVGGVDASQETTLPPRRVALVEFEGWAQKHLRPTDAVALEASTHAWYVHDLLEPIVGRLAVAHPYHVKLIAASMVKIDKRDTLTLAHLLAANLLPEVWVPPRPVRELRALVNHRKRLVEQRSMAKNRLQSLLQHHHLILPDKRLTAVANRDWLQELPLAGSEQLRVRQELLLIDQLTELIKAAEAELAHLSVSPPWREQVAFLVQLPGLGMQSAMTVLGAVGDITRFPSAKKLVGYAGMGARVHASGQRYRTGGITKQGRRELRAVMVEAAWAAVWHDATWKAHYERLAQRIGKQKAIVAAQSSVDCTGSPAAC